MITAGEKLRSTRLEKGITLDGAEKATRIKKPFLEAIERNDYKSLPSPTYAQGFVKNYAFYLGIPNQDIMPLFKRQFDEKKAYDVLPQGFTRSQTLSTHHLRIHRTVIALTLIFLLFVSYLALQFRSLFVPPSLHLTSPSAHASVVQETIVSGSTDTEATVYVNGNLVALDQNGKFSKRLTLFPGKMTVTVVSRNRFGKETKIEREVMVKSRS